MRPAVTLRLAVVAFATAVLLVVVALAATSPLGPLVALVPQAVTPEPVLTLTPDVTTATPAPTASGSPETLEVPDLRPLTLAVGALFVFLALAVLWRIVAWLRDRAWAPPGSVAMGGTQGRLAGVPVEVPG